MLLLFSKFFRQTNPQSNVSTKNHKKRSLRLESLEERALLAVTFQEFNAINARYDLGLPTYTSDEAMYAAYNVIEIDSTDLTDASLRNAIGDAVSDSRPDLIVVRTTASNHTITLSAGQLGIAGSGANKVNLVSWGTGSLIISGNNQSRVFNIGHNANVAIAGITITGGNASGNGGGLYFNSDSRTAEGGGPGNSTLLLSSVIFDTNTASGSGGGMAQTRYGNAAVSTLNNVLFVGNVSNGTGASNIGGGGMAVLSAGDANNAATLTNCTFVNNRSNGTAGAGLFSDQQNNVTVRNSIFWGNNTNHAVKDINLVGGTTGTSKVVTYSVWNTGSIQTASATNQTGSAADPKLDAKHRPTPLSATIIDKGTGVSLTKDILGNTRVVGDAIDIGAFESPFLPDKVLVTTLEDQADGNYYDGISLREAVALAKITGNDITFAPSLSGTILLNSEILIDKSITIAGPGNIAPGTSKIVLSGNRQTRIFNIQSGSGTIDVSISGLALASGNTSGDGGAIRAANARLTLTNVNVYSNTSAKSGGAIYLDGGTLTVNRSVFNANRAGQNGGHIAIENGTMTIQDNTSLLAGSAKNGGALYANEAVTTFGTVTFSKNSASQYGGGFYQEAGVSNFYGATAFTNNKAYFGGGISVTGGSVNMPGHQTTLFSGNQAEVRGGGLFVMSSAAAATVNLANVSFAGNSVVNGNGGAIALQGALANLSVTNGTFTNNSGAYGSTIYQQGAASSFSNCVFDSNIASRQGTVFADGGSVTLKQASFIGNEALAFSGLYVYNGAASLTDTTFTGGKTVNARANAIMKYASGSMTIKSGDKVKTFDAALNHYLNEGEDWFN